LDPDGPDGGAAGGIERPILETSQVGVETHLAAKRVQFDNQVGFGKSADSRVAGHEAQGVAAGSDEHRFAAHSRGGEGGFASGVARTDNKNVSRLPVALFFFSIHSHIIPRRGLLTDCEPWHEQNYCIIH